MAPERHEGYLMLAIHQRSRGELESAIKLLDQAIERTRSDAQPAVLQAMIYHDLGRLSDAFKSAQTAQRLDPSSTQAQLLVSAIGSQIQNRAVADVPVGID